MATVSEGSDLDATRLAERIIDAIILPDVYSYDVIKAVITYLLKELDNKTFEEGAEEVFVKDILKFLNAKLED